MVIDFVLTLELLHTLFTMWYSWQFIWMRLWWGTKGIETAIMIMGGRYFCRMRELRPIEFGMGMVYEMVPPTEAQADESQGQGNENVQNGGQL
jgi:Integral membrane protein S linking to the trans Golgi network